MLQCLMVSCIFHEGWIQREKNKDREKERVERADVSRAEERRADVTLNLLIIFFRRHDNLDHHRIREFSVMFTLNHYGPSVCRLWRNAPPLKLRLGT